MRILAWRALVGLILAMVCAFAVDVKSVPPGTLTYIAGEAWIGSQSLNEKAVGTVLLKPGQQLSIRNGIVEVMLAPHIFIRVAKNSSANLISLDTTAMEIELKQGQAIIEISGSLKAGCSSVRTRFAADRVQFRVFRGKAFVQEGRQRVLWRANANSL